MAEINLNKCTTFQTLSAKKKKFVLEYHKDFNATQSAIRAGYSTKTAYSQGQRLLKKVEIQKAIAEVSEQLTQNDTASISEILKFLTSVMRGNVKDVVSWKKDGLVFTASSEEIDESTSKLVKRVKVTEKTSQKGDWTECKTEVELHDPVKAAELLGKYHGIFKDKLEHSGPNGGPVQFNVRVNLVSPGNGTAK